MTKQDIIERAKRVSLSSNPKDYIDFVGELAKENKPIPSDIQEAADQYAAEQTPVEYPNLYGEEAIKTAYASGMLAERERLMKEAVECNVIWYDGRLLDITQEQLDAALDKIGAGVDAKVSVIIIKKENGGVLENYENRFGDTIHNTDD